MSGLWQVLPRLGVTSPGGPRRRHSVSARISLPVRAHRGGAALARGWERPAAAAVSSVRGCQHFQPRDNRALFPCHRGKRINIPRVCFQAALWNKSQTVVVSPGSPARGTACSHPVSHRRLAAPPRPRAAAGAAPCRLCRGHLEHNCSASAGSSAWHRRVSGSTSPPDTSAARTALATLSSGPVSGSGSIFEGKGLCCGTGESGEGSQGLFLFPLPRGEGNPRDAMASVLPPVGTCVSNAHLEWWDLPPSHGAGSLV